MDRGPRFARTVFIHNAEEEEGGKDEEAAVADDDDDQRTQDGDSTVASSAASADEAESRGGAGAAVAAAHDSYMPRVLSSRRPWKRVPIIETSNLSEKQRALVDAWEEKTEFEAGRVGFYVANFGGTAARPTQRADEWAQLRANPAQIIALCECDDETCAVLSGEHDARDSAAAVADDRFRSRTQYNYLCVKGGEPSGTLLVGMRDRSGGHIEHVDFARLFHKQEKSKTKKKKKQSAVAEAPAPKLHNKYSRAMVVRVHLDQAVTHLGGSFNVMAVHVHHSLANQDWGVTKLHEFYNWFVAYVREWDVKVCMGDFNMCMFQLVSWCRNCGLTVDVAAWTPWKTAGGQPRADSMAILFINCPGQYKLHHGLSVLHDREGGFLTTQHDPSFPVFDYTNGPGKMLQTYVPKAEPVENKMRAFLTPSGESLTAVAEFEQRMARRERDDWVRHPFRVKQGNLDDKIWHGAFGRARHGAHFPLVAFTHNTCRRSPERLAARLERRKGGRKGGKKGGKKGSYADTAVAGKGVRPQMGTAVAGRDAGAERAGNTPPPQAANGDDATPSCAAVAAGSWDASGSGAWEARSPATRWQGWSWWDWSSSEWGADGAQWWPSDHAAVADNAPEGSPPQREVEWGSSGRPAERPPWSFEGQCW